MIQLAKIVLTSEYLALAGTDVSSNIKKAELTLESDAQEVTTFGDAGWKTFLAGLKSAELAISYLNDVAAAALDSIMFPLFGTVVTFEVRASNAVVGTSNPKYTGSVLIDKWQPIGGGVGDVNAADVSYKSSGAVSRATS